MESWDYVMLLNFNIYSRRSYFNSIDVSTVKLIIIKPYYNLKHDFPSIKIYKKASTYVSSSCLQFQSNSNDFDSTERMKLRNWNVGSTREARRRCTQLPRSETRQSANFDFAGWFSLFRFGTRATPLTKSTRSERGPVRARFIEWTF